LACDRSGEGKSSDLANFNDTGLSYARTPSDLISFNPTTTGLTFHPIDMDFVNGKQVPSRRNTPDIYPSYVRNSHNPKLTEDFGLLKNFEMERQSVNLCRSNNTTFVKNDINFVNIFNPNFLDKNSQQQIPNMTNFGNNSEYDFGGGPGMQAKWGEERPTHGTVGSKRSSGKKNGFDSGKKTGSVGGLDKRQEVVHLDLSELLKYKNKS
jgi:hypothetical protein